MYTADYLPASKNVHTKHGFATEDDAWQHICPNCPEWMGTRTEDDYPCACTAEWRVVKTTEYYVDMLDSRECIVDDMFKLAAQGKDEKLDGLLEDYFWCDREIDSAYAALTPQDKIELPSP